jgi:hypothetical protein
MKSVLAFVSVTLFLQLSNAQVAKDQPASRTLEVLERILKVQQALDEIELLNPTQYLKLVN